MLVFTLQEGNQQKNVVYADVLYAADSFEKILSHIFGTKYETREFVVTRLQGEERTKFWINTKCSPNYP